MRACNVLVLILIVAVGVPAYGEEMPVQTTRDAQGIWHIEGGSLYDVFEAMGYAVAKDRLFQMDLFKRQGRGTLSEVLGPDFLSTDVFIRTIGYSEEELTAEFESLSDDGKAAIQGYANGINRRIAEIYSDWHQMPYEFWVGSFFYFVVEDLGFNYLPTPWTPNDVIAWTAMFFRGFDPEALSTGQLDNAVLFQTWLQVFPAEALPMFMDIRWINDPSAQTMIPPPTVQSVGKLRARRVTREANAAATYDAAQAVPVSAGSFESLKETVDGIKARIAEYKQKMDDLGVRPKMGSYAWALAGSKTDSGNPMLYSGPQMGFDLPSIVCEGSIRGGGIEVSGMHVPGIPGIAVGRTPHHAWSAQVGHAHTTDFYFEAPESVALNRFETIKVAGGDDVTIPVWRSSHGPIISPLPYNPAAPPDRIVSWAYANWGHEAAAVDALLNAARATSIEEFGDAVGMIGVSQHTCYIDRDGNIAYWMTGFDPIRAPHPNPLAMLFPQAGDGTQEWTGEFRPRAHTTNPDQGYIGGWNNKASIDYHNAPQSAYYGPAHRAHVIDEYLAANDDITFEEMRDLALNIATTDSFGGGGNTWSFVADFFKAAVAANPTADRNAAIDMLDAWDGHFVAGGPAAWRFGDMRADAWVLQDAWIREVLRLTFHDEFAASNLEWDEQPTHMLFNVLLRALAGNEAALPTLNDWFRDRLASGKPTTSEGIILMALDNVIADMGLGPYNKPREVIYFGHDLLATLLDPAFGMIHSIPFSSRSTYAQAVEIDETGPIRIESMFPLGPSGQLWFDGTFDPTFDDNFFTMAPAYDPFLPRPFPLFD